VTRREFLALGIAAPVALARAPWALGRILGGTPVALVTADTEEHVAAVDLFSGRVVKRIATKAGPRSIESVVATTAVVAHTEEGVVTLLDASSLTVTRVLRAFSVPRYTAASPDGRHAYVTDSGPGELVTLDLARARVVHRLELEGPARHVTLDPMGRRLWAALGTKAEEIAVISLRDADRPRLVGRVRPPFLAHDVAFSPRGTTVWVTSGDRGTVAAYDAETRGQLFQLPADLPPQHVSFGRGRAFVTSGDDAMLRVHALSDGKLMRTTRIPVGSFNVTGGWQRVLTPSLSLGTLCVLETRGEPVTIVQVAAAAHDACFVVSA
jgi:DNA-binding beta-propeller fold protein YncE